MQTIRWAILMIGVSVLGEAQAADSGPFVEFDLGRALYPRNYYTQVPAEVPGAVRVLTNSTLNRERFGWSLSAGYRIDRYLIVEAAFVDLGSIRGLLTDASHVTSQSAPLSFSAKGETLAIVGTLPLGRFELFAKGGVFFADTDLRIADGRTSGNTQHGLLGVGVLRHYGEKWRYRLSWTEYLRVGDAPNVHGPNVRLLSVGLAYNF